MGPGFYFFSGLLLIVVGLLDLLFLLQRNLLNTSLGHADDVGILVESIQLFQPGNTLGAGEDVAVFDGPGLHLEASVHGHGTNLNRGVKWIFFGQVAEDNEVPCLWQPHRSVLLHEKSLLIGALRSVNLVATCSIMLQASRIRFIPSKLRSRVLFKVLFSHLSAWPVRIFGLNLVILLNGMMGAGPSAASDTAASDTAALDTAGSAVADKGRVPNIIIMMVDDMGFSDIGPYGSEIPTPHLDAMASGGVKFSQFYNTGRCCPTRASLLSGLYSHQAGIGWMTTDQGLPGYQGRLNNRCVTIAEVLRDAGYFTAMTGKWHVGHDSGGTPPERGFDRSLNLAAGGVHFSNQTGSKGGAPMFLNGEKIGPEDPRLDPPWYGTDLWTRQGLSFIDEAIRDDQPFLWYYAHVAPHFPCMAPEATIAKYRGKYREGWDRLREQRYARQVAAGLIDPEWKLEARPETIPAWESLPEQQQLRYDDMMAIYAAMIEEIDQSVGRIMSALRERDQLDNTLFLFLSDNGGNAETGVNGKYEGDRPGDPHSNVFIGKCWAHLNNTPFRKYKHYNHEGGIATPLIAHWPNQISSNEAWITTPTHLIDLMATCVDLSASKYPSQRVGQTVTPMQGQSLRPLLTGEGSFADRPLYWEHEGNAAIRVGDRKLVREGSKGAWELFDLSTDRTEQTPIDDPDQQKQMQAQWTKWARSANVLPKPTKSKKLPKGKRAGKKKRDAA